MPSGVSFSKRHIGILEYADYHKDVIDSLNHFFDDRAPEFVVRWALMTRPEVSKRLAGRIAEVELTSSLTLLGGIEALFRMDYANRVQQKQKDDLSRAFRDLYKRQELRVNLEETLLGLWKAHTNVDRDDIASLRAAFKYRHWLAHGRYWTPKLGQVYTFKDIYNLAQAIKAGFPFVLA